MKTREEIEEVAKVLVDIAFHIHTKLGPGLFESVYEEVFCIELRKRGVDFKRQQMIDIVYEDQKISNAFQYDIKVEDCIIVELKSIEKFSAVHYKQLGTYLKLTDTRLGLLINFNENLIKDGVRRVVNNL